MSELVPLADAADLLGVSVERVRQLVVARQLPGQRIANVWVVPRSAIDARRHSPGVRGRPLSPVKAWEEILGGSINLRHPGRYQHRASIIRCEISDADAAALPKMFGAMLGGVRAAIDLGEQLAPDDGLDVYLSAESYVGLDEQVAYVLDAAGRMSLRVVADEAWRLLPKAVLAPPAAVALDLLESGDPRHWISAENLARGNG